MSLSLYKIHLSFHCPRQLHPHSRSQPAILFPIALRKQRPTEGKFPPLPLSRQPTSLARVPGSSFPPIVHYGSVVCAPSQGQSFLLDPITHPGAQCLQCFPLSPIIRLSLSPDCKNTVQYLFPVLTAAALSRSCPNSSIDTVASSLPTPVCPHPVSVALCYPSAI